MNLIATSRSVEQKTEKWDDESNLGQHVWHWSPSGQSTSTVTCLRQTKVVGLIVVQVRVTLVVERHLSTSTPSQLYEREHHLQTESVPGLKHAIMKDQQKIFEPRVSRLESYPWSLPQEFDQFGPIRVVTPGCVCGCVGRGEWEEVTQEQPR